MVWRIASENIIINNNVFSENYTPPSLPVRGDKAELLLKKYMYSLGSSGPVDISLIFGVIGRVGIGKSTLARYVGKKLAELAKKEGYNVVYIHANVFAARSSQEVINLILRHLNRAIPARGVSKIENLYQLVDYLYRNDLYLLVTLDEFQRLVEPWFVDDGILYALLRINEEIPSRDGITRIGYILVAEDFRVLSRMKERLPQVESQISFKEKLEPYKVKELYEIVKQRAELGLRRGSWSDDILWTIAEEYGIDGSGHRPEGDARKAILVLKKAAEIATFSGSPVIDKLHLSKAFAYDLEANIPESTIRGLSKHELLVLLSVAQLTLEKRHNAMNFSTTGEVRQRYEELCELYGETPRRHSQFNEYITHLTHLGLIDRRISGKGMRGKTSLMRIPSEIPPNSLKELIESILLGEENKVWI